MGLLDIILLLPLVLGVIRGFFNGLVHEMVSFAALILGVYLAYLYADEVVLILQDYISQNGVPLRILSYLLIFGGVMLIAFSLSFILTKLLQIMALGILNRLLGALFGLAKSLLILMLLVHLFQPYIHSSQEWTESFEESIVYNYLRSWGLQAGEWLGDVQAEQGEINLPVIQE